MRESQEKLIPILVGITGHRDIADEGKLIDDIAGVLKDLAGRYPASPLVLLTPLAEGADRAAAKAVLRLSASGQEVSFMTVLPMAEAEYLGTFSGPDSVQEYMDLKAQGIGSKEVPHCSVEDKPVSPGPEELYANLGAFLALHTQVLIAVWNGAEEEKALPCKAPDGQCIGDGAGCLYLNVKPGGTYHVLRQRFFGVEEEYTGPESFLSKREYGPIYWIKARRRSSQFVAPGAAVVGPAFPLFPVVRRADHPNKECSRLVTDCFRSVGQDGRTYAEILTKLNAYNADVRSKSASMQDAVEAARRDFLSSENGIMPLEEGGIVSHYSVSDCLSVYYQRKRRLDIVLLMVLAFTGLLCFSLYSGPLISHFFIVGYSLLYLAACMFYIFKVKRDRHHEKYVDYRGIAEGLRVQFFWNLLDIPANVTDVFLSKQKSSVSWIKIAVDNVVLLSKVRAKKRRPGDGASKLHIARELWLEKQQEYYSRKHPRKYRVDTGQRRLETVLFCLGLAAAVLLAGIDAWEALLYGTSGAKAVLGAFASDAVYVQAHQWIVFGVGFLPVIIASFKVFTELMAYSKLARNYKWMRMVYELGLQEFDRIRALYAAKPETLVRKSRKLLYDIGVEALADTADWIGILDDRVPELPK